VVNGLKFVKVYVTDEQYEFLRSLRKQKVSMSAFMRGLLHMYMCFSSGREVRIVDEEVVTRIRRRRVCVETERERIWRDVQRELKEVFKKKGLHV